MPLATELGKTLADGARAVEFCTLEAPITSMRKLNDVESNALREYQNGAGINIPLREDRPLIDLYAKQVRDIDSAMVGNVTQHEVVAYRGMNAFFTKDLKEGMEFIDKGFVSVTFDQRIASGFGNVIELRIPAGTPALDVSRLLGERSLYDQKELLIQRGLRYRVDQGLDRLVLTVLR